MSPRYEVVFNSQQHLHLPSRYNTFIIESESLALAPRLAYVEDLSVTPLGQSESAE